MKIESKKPRKQRKLLYTAPIHTRRNLMASHLSKDLRKQYKLRSLSVRKGDEVEIMRGEHTGKTGKISRIDLKNYKVYIEGITIKRTEGTEKQIPIHPSNLKIINLNLDDEFRNKILNRKIKGEKHGSIEKVANTKVLESAKENKEMGSGTKSRPAQKV